ncbi:hypothetical protein L0F63_004364, partial [Massospora cicadina]
MVQFARLPSHLSPKRLLHELTEDEAAATPANTLLRQFSAGCSSVGHRKSPHTIFHLTGKRARTGSPIQVKPMRQIVPPKDLDTHLACTQAVPCCPLVLPQSNMRYGLRGYYNLGFTFEADAATSATVPLVFQGAFLPTTWTWLPADTTLVVQFASLPTHLPTEVLHQELMDGLAAYGSNPILQFV